LLHLSGLTITFGKSSYYLRLTYLLHGFAVVALLKSSLPIYAEIGMVFILMVSITQIVRNKTPLPAYTQLSYHMTHWLLHDIHGQSMRYEQAHISFDAGLFMLLTLTSESSARKLVVFRDQLSDAQYRALNVIGKISVKKKHINSPPH